MAVFDSLKDNLKQAFEGATTMATAPLVGAAMVTGATIADPTETLSTQAVAQNWGREISGNARPAHDPFSFPSGNATPRDSFVPYRDAANPPGARPSGHPAYPPGANPDGGRYGAANPPGARTSGQPAYPPGYRR